MKTTQTPETPNLSVQKLARLLDSKLGRLYDYRVQASGPPLPGTEPAQH